MQDHGALGVGQAAVEEALHIGSVGHPDASAGLAGDHRDLGGWPAGPVLRGQVLVAETAQVSGEAFVQPEVLPAAAGHLVAEPLVGQFMRGQFVEIGAHEGHGLVLHTAAALHLGVAVLLVGEGVGAEELAEEGHLLQHVACVQVGQEGVLRVGVGEHGEGVRRQFHRKHQLHVIGHRGGDQVVGDRVAVPPVEAHLLVAGQGVRGHQHPVARSAVPHRNGHVRVDGIDLVVQVLLRGPPVQRAIGLAQGPDDGDAVMRVEAPAAQTGGGGRSAVMDGH